MYCSKSCCAVPVDPRIDSEDVEMSWTQKTVTES